MHKSLTQTISLLFLLFYTLLSIAEVPITAILQPSAPTSLPANSMGSANYLVHYSSRLSFPLTLSVKGLPSGVNQNFTGPSPCVGAPTICQQTFTLTPNGSCCLRLSLDASAMQTSTLISPIISTTPPAYQVKGTSLTVNRTPPQYFTITSSSDANGAISPVGTNVVNYGASQTFTARANPAYGVYQWLVDGAVVSTGSPTYTLTNITANHTVMVTYIRRLTTYLTMEPATLALSVNCPTVSTTGCIYNNAALTGNPRQITITNTSTTDATTPLTITSAALPTETTITTDNCTGIILDPLGTCTVTITPGPIASSGTGSNACTSGIVPNPGTISANADSALSPALSDVYVLSYGCIYQGGFIYSVDDSYTNYPETGSIGGKIAAVYDTVAGQTPGQPGSPNWGNSTIDIGSSLWVTDSQGANNGSANSIAINNRLHSFGNASGLCSLVSVDANGSPSCAAPSICYTDWYLPAICELGPYGSICTNGSTNIHNQLYNANPPITANLVEGLYWSSTEVSGTSAASHAMMQGFYTNGGGAASRDKGYIEGVRCSRALTL